MNENLDDELYNELQHLRLLKESCEEHGIELRDLLLYRLEGQVEVLNGVAQQLEELKDTINYYTDNH